MSYERKINDSIYNASNPYGFKLNINHPKIKAYYQRYKAWKGYGFNTPLTNEERFEFERYMLDKLQKI